MTVAIMAAAFAALQAALPVPVTRAWPQSPPALPGCAFRLLSWQRAEDGTAIVSLLVLLRVKKPEDGDAYSSLAQTAMHNLGYIIDQASDELDEASGFFLRSLTFTGRQAAPLKPNVITPGFQILLKSATSLWLPPPEPASYSIIPASRKPLVNTKPSFSAARLPLLLLDRVQPAALILRCPWSHSYSIIDELRTAFRTGALIQARVSLRDPNYYATLDTQVTEFSATPLGVHATLLMLDI